MPLAASTFPLSPPDVIHLIPPYTRKPKASNTATINNRRIIEETSGPIPALPISQRV